jgi:MEMO1 family protein
MKKWFSVYASVVILLITLFSCQSNNLKKQTVRNIRPLKDTIGFAQYSWQMDSLMARIDRAGWEKSAGTPWNLVICPHDDYTYVGKLYPELLQNIKAPNLILIGVAHKAAQMGIEDSLIFDSYTDWKGPWRNIKVSPAREEIYHLLRGKYATINDSLQKVEHSVEALIPWLQYFNKNITIIPILVPAMNPERMKACGKALAEAIKTVADSHKWEWGTDYAIVVTTDAVHYGNEDWGGIDRAYFGCDEKGNIKALNHETQIIDSCFKGDVTPEKISLFNSYTLNHENFREYKWTWCGRYSVPVALYAAYYLNNSDPLWGDLVGYSTSITSAHVVVDDIRMGRTAIATKCHWVGYASIGYTLNSEKRRGLVTISAGNLKKEPSHSSEMVSQAILGTPVLILKSEDSWLQIETPDNYTGWIEESSIKKMNEQELSVWKKSARVVYLENTGWLYETTAEKSGVVSDLVGGSITEKTGESGSFVSIVLPDGRKGFIEKRKVLDFNKWENPVPNSEESVCSLAMTYMGIPYLWGGSSTKAVDCSGFVQSVYFRNGIILRRDASLQALHGLSVDISDGFSRLKKGDLLFFGSRKNGISHVTHVALYLGNSEYINASGRVQINSLDSTKADFNSHRINSLLQAKRVVGITNDHGIEPVSKHPWYLKY